MLDRSYSTPRRPCFASLASATQDVLRSARIGSTNAGTTQNGGGGIRTPGTLAGTTVFKTVPISRSGTPPGIGGHVRDHSTTNAG